MNLNQWLFIGIIFLELAIYVTLFSKRNIKRAIDTNLTESEKYSNIDNFIKIKEYEFDGTEKIFGLFIGFILIILFGIKITGLLGLISFVLMGITLTPMALIYQKLNRLHSQIIRELYLKKDRKN